MSEKEKSWDDVIRMPLLVRAPDTPHTVSVVANHETGTVLALHPISEIALVTTCRQPCSSRRCDIGTRPKHHPAAAASEAGQGIAGRTSALEGRMLAAPSIQRAARGHK